MFLGELFVNLLLISIIAAWKVENFENLVDGKEGLDDAKLEACRCFELFLKLEGYVSLSSVATRSLLSYYKNTDMNHTGYMFKQLYKATAEDLRRVGKEYVLPLFDPTRSSCAISCNPSEVQEVVDEFKKKMSRDLNVIKDIEDSFLSKF